MHNDFFYPGYFYNPLLRRQTRRWLDRPTCSPTARFVVERVLTSAARDAVNRTDEYNTLICAVSDAEQRYTMDTRYIYHGCLCPAVNTGWDQAAMFPRWCGDVVTLIVSGQILNPLSKSLCQKEQTGEIRDGERGSEHIPNAVAIRYILFTHTVITVRRSCVESNIYLPDSTNRRRRGTDYMAKLLWSDPCSSLAYGPGGGTV